MSAREWNDRSRNDLSGAADDVVQARDVSGGVHFHGAGRAAGPIPRQLPADVRGFVNRARDLERLDVIFADDGPESDGIATCVMVGTAGVGKTSLAVHWAHQVVDRFPDGQLYVNLHGYDPGPPVTPDQVLDRFLRALDVPAESIPADSEARAALYRSLLAGRRFLVVLDNAATAGQVRPLLPGITGCLVLVTSRSMLSGLVARDGAYRVGLGLLSEAEAVDLLRKVTAGYRPEDDPGEFQELARLCARLPLALRIAAERAGSRPQMPLRELIADLRDESGLWDALTAETDDESAAVRTVFAWSYRALSKDASRLFRLLGLHPGPDFGSSAAAALAGSTAGRTRRLLDDLVGAHLLEQPLPGRFLFHDLLRAYAIDQAHSEETVETADAAVRRVLLWYLHTAIAATRVLAPEGQSGELAELDESVSVATFTGYGEANAWYERERTNLLTVSRVAESRAMDDIAWQIAVVLYPVYSDRSQFDDWITTSSLALTAVRRSGSRAGEAEVLDSLGKAHVQSGDREAGIDFQHVALEIRRELGDRAGVMNSTNALGLARLRGRESDAALSLFEQANAIAVELDDDDWIAITLNNIANVYLDFERYQEAADLLGRALVIYRRHGNSGGVGDALRGLSHARRGLRDPDAALGLISEALDIAREQENQAWEGFWLVELGQVHRDLGDFTEALTAYQRAAMVQRRLGDRVREALALDATGEAYQHLGRYDEAADFHRLAVLTFREMRDDWQCALALDNLASALQAAGDYVEAEARWGEAFELLARFPGVRSDRIQARIREMSRSEGRG
jgi:tetratricopeptide (TPR) repeat protein